MSSNCYYTTCQSQCCNYYGSCPEDYSAYGSYYNSYYTSCYYYYNSGYSVSVTTPGGTIGGSVSGSVVFVIIFIILYIYYRRRNVNTVPVEPVHRNDQTIIVNSAQPNTPAGYYGVPTNYPNYGYPQNSGAIIINN
jgi:hypothetical protein